MGISCDFSGYATRNDLLCGDGRIIRKMLSRIVMERPYRLYGTTIIQIRNLFLVMLFLKTETMVYTHIAHLMIPKQANMLRSLFSMVM